MVRTTGKSILSSVQIPARFEALEELAAPPGLRLVRARDTLLEREVFLELPAIGAEADAPDIQVSQRRLREARALARIDHPSVQRLLEVLEAPGGLLLVLEPTLGETLATRLAREGRLPPADVAALAVALAEALEVVHDAQVLHRGIEASCIVLHDGGRVMLTGFRLAKPAGAPSTLVLGAGALAALGPAHPAPEQITSHQDSPRSDLFSLGWVLFESLAGRPPYVGLDPRSWTTPPDPRAIVPATPIALARAISSCLALSPAQRPADAAALRRALGASAGAPAAAAGAPRSGLGARWPRRRLWAGVAAAAGALQVALLVSGWLSAPDVAKAQALVAYQRLQGQAGSSVDGTAYTATYEHSRALLIGIGPDYAQVGWPPLPRAEGDVEKLKTALLRRDAWEEAIALTGRAATKDGILEAVKNLVRKSGPNDRLLIWYAGHGTPLGVDETEGALIPVDARIGNPASYLPFSWFDQVFVEAGAPKHILIVLDCCYGGRLAERVDQPGGAATAAKPATRDAGEAGLSFGARYLTRPAHIVLSSGRKNDMVLDDSPVLDAFLEALGGDGPLTSTGLLGVIQTRFMSLKLAQTPMMSRVLRTSRQDAEVVFLLEK